MWYFKIAPNYVKQFWNITRGIYAKYHYKSYYYLHGWNTTTQTSWCRFSAVSFSFSAVIFAFMAILISWILFLVLGGLPQGLALFSTAAFWRNIEKWVIIINGLLKSMCTKSVSKGIRKSERSRAQDRGHHQIHTRASILEKSRVSFHGQVALFIKRVYHIDSVVNHLKMACKLSELCCNTFGFVFLVIFLAFFSSCCQLFSFNFSNASNLAFTSSTWVHVHIIKKQLGTQ